MDKKSTNEKVFKTENSKLSDFYTWLNRTITSRHSKIQNESENSNDNVDENNFKKIPFKCSRCNHSNFIIRERFIDGDEPIVRIFTCINCNNKIYL